MRILLLNLILIICSCHFATAQNDTLEHIEEWQIELGEGYKNRNTIDKYDSSVINPAALPNNYKQAYLDNKDFDYKREQTRNYMSEFRDWLENLIMEFFKITKREQVSRLVDILLNAIYGVIILLVVYLIARAIFRKEGRWIFSKKIKIINDKDLYIASEVDIEQIDQLVLKYKGDGNYRMAIRYYFIWLLKQLAERNIIKLESDKTATDYAYEINDRATKNDFQYAAYLYNYIWFGEFDIDKTAFEAAEQAFKKIIGNA